MKKTCSLLLALALCLSLCACGADKAYQPLLEHLEAGSYEGVKAELRAMSPEFAAEQEELARYREYAGLIDSLERGDYEAAAADFSARIPAPSEPTYHEQEITPDNWQTYFEIVREEDWHLNGFGEAESYSVYYRFKLRDEYLTDPRPASLNISVELGYRANYHQGSVDLSTREVVIGEIATNISGMPTGDVTDVFDIGWITTNGVLFDVQTFLIQWDDGSQNLYVVEDMPTVVRIQGTIQLPD